MHQVRVASLACYAQVAGQVGLDGPAMLREAGLQLSGLSDPEMRISAGAAVRLLEMSAERSGFDSFGLLMGEARPYSSLGPLSLLLERLENVGQVLGALSRYRRHLNDVLNLAVEEQDGTSLIRVELIPEYARTQVLDYSLGFVAKILHCVSGGRWEPSMIHLERKAPSDLSVARRLFRVPVEFESTFNGLSCPADSLTIALPLANAEMAHHAESLLALVPLGPEDAPISERTKRLVIQLLPKGITSVEHVAGHFGISTRALQRSLEHEGQSFALLLNEARRELSKRYLTNSTRSITAVAELTGYASLSSFSRWFAREFGMSPHSWRVAKSRNLPPDAQS
ncbi:helix-turn-helix transcriptional regulator [Croceibacterium sp. LX-88]|uniref:Helix-turn-helix transcriptional regulator n=1 Tax=Croceibacterium selenioxidans TaxID=2838833 RepID=A0ABS5W7N6_9SPHN|nr:helix-turn-helix transcriptional regulator [Croceibacterium selenioxidans]